MDTTLRDAHQSQIATRMTTEQMLPILPIIDKCNYDAVEVWGGATFDACIRFLNEDPWERLRVIKKHVKTTKLQMLLRGQNLVGYRHYSDDVVDEFIRKAIENGIDVIRVFDALNDIRNLDKSMKSIKKYGGEVQATICYTISDVHTDEYYLELVKEFLKYDIDSLSLKDMAGILTPKKAYDLVSKIKEITKVPLQVHTHATSGLSEMVYLKAIEAGADIIDTAVSTMSGGTSQPATETMVIALKELGYQVEVNLDAVAEVSKLVASIKEEFINDGLFNFKVLEIDPNTLEYQVPGGMISNLLNQLKEGGQLDKFSAVLHEIPKVRAELGYPPLVTPLSQMVGTQAVMNVLTGRYKMIPKEIKDYVKGYYGKSPVQISDNIKRLIVGDSKTIDIRPADLLEPELPKAYKDLENITDNIEDVLSYVMFPQISLPFISKKYDPFYDIEIQEVTVLIDN